MVFGSWVRAQVFTDSSLPIVVIETDGGVAIPDDPKVLGTMKVIWHPDGSRNYLTDIDNPAFLNYNGRIGIETRGYSSQMISKKPYSLTTLQADNVTHNNVSILGMPEENDWVLNNLAYDQTGMRDVLTYGISEQMGQYTPRRVYCEVMVNGDYKGLYVFMEKIKVDKNRVNVEKLDQNSNSFPEVTGGYLMQADRGDNTNYAWTMPTYLSNWWWPETVTFVYCYPKRSDITDVQSDYIHNVFTTLASVAQNHNTDPVSGIPSVIDIPSFVDFMLLAEFSSNVDVYQLSTYYHKDRCGKLRAGPIWDFNLAYGYDEFGDRSRYDVWQFDNGDNVGPTFWKDLFDTDEFRCYLAKRWFELTQLGQPFNYDMIYNQIVETNDWIIEAVGRDNQRWHTMYNHNGALEEMKTWLLARINWLNQNIGSCEACSDMEVPPLVISKIHYHPEDWWGIDGDRLEFIEITNNGDHEVDLTGVYFRELGMTYGFPVGSSIMAHKTLLLCSDSLAFIDYYNRVPFGQYQHKLSNKSENLVLVDAWGNVIDEVHYYDSDPWPWEADGEGAFLQLIDLDLDNSLPESWTVGYDITSAPEFISEEGFRVFPNPAQDWITVWLPPCDSPAVESEYRITNLLGQTLMTGTFSAEVLQLDVSHLSTGMYFITVGNQTQKLEVKQ